MEAVRHSLDLIFKPRSVAVMGASDTPGSVGRILIHNLLANPFGGVVYPVNPNRQSVHGVNCYPNLEAIQEAVDLAVIATPAATVPGLIQECVQHGIPAAIIISAGFSERGAEGRQLEEEIRIIARGKMRIIGPNCLGVIHPPSNLNASFAACMARPGKVALLSQSGAICTSILDWAQETRVGFSSFISVGTMLDVDFADLMDYFADDPRTRSIVLYMETIGDARKFLSAARSVSRTKQVIVVKAGRHEAAARAATSHTWTLAGTDAAFDAAFRRAGVLRVTTIPHLFHMSEILAMQPQPRGPALALISNAGGPGVMATDALLTGGGQLATLSDKTLEALAALPPSWSHANPIDLLGDATAERYKLAVEVCARDPNVQGLLVLLSPQALTDPTATARALVPFAHLDHKPLLACWMGAAAVREGKQILNEAGIPTFDAPESAIRAFLHMVQYRRNQELLYETPQALPADWTPDSQRVRQLFQQARSAGRTLLTEAEAKEVLDAYGLPMSFPGVTVQPMVRDKGQELILGSSIDRQFGPIILFGAGGLLVEVFKDQALGLPPLNRTLARHLIERTRISHALKGVRGQKPVNLEELETLLVRFSQLLVDFPEIQEIDINPLLAGAEQIIALDARVLLSPAGTPPPRLAIHPYPNQYTALFRLKGGTEVTIRAISPEDEPLIIELHASHSEHTIRMRFFSLVKILSRDSLIRLCHLDYDREMALVAVRRLGERSQILGVSRYYRHPETGTAEFALVVRDSCHRLGLGRQLMHRLIAIARERGVKRLAGVILVENRPMLDLMRSLGFSDPVLVEGNVVQVALDLR